MKIIKTAEEMQDWSRLAHKNGKTIAFVPTMGALHEGHLSLLREGRHRADKLVLSIYVNPTQFGPGEDYSRYPKQIDADLRMAEELKTDAVFLPSDDIMYPKGFQTYVTVEDVTKHLCGASRPNHFRGVATVVLKLFNIVQPDVAVFGEKDYQQLVVIRRMARDLNLRIDVIGTPIVREKDGLAMSSRNRYLSANERKAALSISRSLNKVEHLAGKGEKNAAKLIEAAREVMIAEKTVHIDYIRICDPLTLVDQKKFSPPALLAVAAFVGPARLIDNRILR